MRMTCVFSSEFPRDKTKLRTLKDRYRTFLEEEKKRSERNDLLLQSLHQIDQQAATLAAKTNRMRMLKVMLHKTCESIYPIYYEASPQKQRVS